METYSQYGESKFSILVHEDERVNLLYQCDLWKEYLDVIHEYKISTKECDYYCILLCIADYHRDGEELCRFVINHIPFIAMHQEDSRFILVKDKETFKKALLDIYKVKERRIYFIYDMLTANERYSVALFGLDKDAIFCDLQLLHTDNKTGCIYQLNFTEDCPYLYEEASEIEIIDNSSGEKLELDIVDYLGNLPLTIAILNKKS